MSCPFCGGAFVIEAESGATEYVTYGVLRCPCEQYPIVEGIPVLKKGLPSEAVGYIHKGDYVSGLMTLLAGEMQRPQNSSRSRVVRLASRLYARAGGKGRECEAKRRQSEKILKLLAGSVERKLSVRELLTAVGIKPAFATYLYYKFGQPRHLVGLSLCQIATDSSGLVLDLGCGAGHVTRSIQARCAGQTVVGIDALLGLLLCAKRLIAPDGEYICCSAEHPLPFRDDSFSQIFSFDALHYVQGKRLCIAELKRLGNADALFCIGSVRNSLVQHAYTRQPQYVSPSLLSDLFGDVPHEIVSDESILACYLEKRGPALGSPSNLDKVSKAELMTLVASRRPDVMRAHPTFETWPHANGTLGINPLYVVCQENQEVLLGREFPSDQYEGENQACKSYMPESARLSHSLYAQLSDHSASLETPGVEDLTDTFVVVGMPVGY